MKIQAVFFDFMGTLARFVPEQEDLLVAAAAAHGLALTQTAARRGFAAVAEWWNLQLARKPLHNRTPAERDALYMAFDQRVLEGAGIVLSPEDAFEVFREVLARSGSSELALYEDALPCIHELAARGMTTGVVSNMGRELPETLEQLGVSVAAGLVVSSGEVGFSKPDAQIFQIAAARAGVAPAAVLYVGDQYQNDVVGARGAGTAAVLLDRYGLQSERLDCVRIASLDEVAGRLA